MSRLPAGGDRRWPDELEVEPASLDEPNCQTLLLPGTRLLSFDPPPSLSLPPSVSLLSLSLSLSPSPPPSLSPGSKRLPY